MKERGRQVDREGEREGGRERETERQRERERERKRERKRGKEASKDRSFCLDKPKTPKNALPLPPNPASHPPYSVEAGGGRATAPVYL